MCKVGIPIIQKPVHEHIQSLIKCLSVNCVFLTSLKKRFLYRNHEILIIVTLDILVQQCQGLKKTEQETTPLLIHMSILGS